VRCNDADTVAIVLVSVVCMYYTFATKIFISLQNNGDLSSKWLTKRKSEFLVLPVNLFGKIELKLVFQTWAMFKINVLLHFHILYIYGLIFNGRLTLHHTVVSLRVFCDFQNKKIIFVNTINLLVFVMYMQCVYHEVATVHIHILF